MPLYEYECDNCGHRFEVIQKFSDDPLTACPKCSGSVRKLVSSPAIQFKGSGWYITDYAKKNSTGAGTSKSDGAGDKAPSSTTDTAAKADAPASKPTPSSGS